MDLVSLVSDDNLLVQLFCEKLKMTFRDPAPTAQEKQQKLRDKVVKEKELREQLEEAKG